MKTTIKELKEDEPLEIITVSHQLKMSMPSEISDRKLENKQIYTKVFTDGIITKKKKNQERK